MRRGYMYILTCSNGAYYTGSTKYLEKRLLQHQNGVGANFTRKHRPVELVYFEEFPNVAEAFYREKQVQGWTHKKKKALIERSYCDLKRFAECMNESHSSHFGSAQCSQ